MSGAEPSFTCELAKSGRSKCQNRTCPDKLILKGQARIGRSVSNERLNWESTQWFHPRCFFEMIKRSRKTDIKNLSEANFVGLDKLPQTDQDLIRALLSGSADAEAPPALSSSPPAASPSPKKSVSASAPEPAPAAPAAAAPAIVSSGVEFHAADGSCQIAFAKDGVHIIGRDCVELKPKNNIKHFSKVQAEITVSSGKMPQLTSRGVNPTVFIPADGSSPRVIQDGECVDLPDGCRVAFCADKQLEFLVVHCREEEEEAKPAPKAGGRKAPQKPKKQPPKKRARPTYDDSDDDDDDDDDEEEEQDNEEDDPTFQYRGGDDDDDDDDYDDDDDDDYAEGGGGRRGRQKDSRPWCKYGANCYRKNEQHLRDFRHPPKKT